MAGTYIAQVTIGGALIGLSTGVTAVGTAFEDFHAVVEAQTAAIDAAVTNLEAQVAALANIGEAVAGLATVILDVKASIRIPAAGDLDAQIAGITQAQVSLTASLANPSAYISGLVAGAGQAITNLQAAVPAAQITGQITAAGLMLAALQAKVSGIDAALALLDAPAAELEVQGEAVATAAAAIELIVDGLDAISIALDAAMAAASTALTQFAAIEATLGTAGAYALIYSGPLSDFGVEMNTALAATGVPPGTQIYAPMIFVLQSDAPAVAAVNATYRTS